MGHKIVYCSDCGKSILEAEFEKGKASTIADRPYCAECRPPAPPARLTPPAQQKIATTRIPVSPSTTRRIGRPSSKVPLIVGGVIGGAALLLLVIAVLSSGGRPPPPVAKPPEPPRAPPAPAPSRLPAGRDPAAADIERAMREEAERAKTQKLDLFLAEIRKMADEDRKVQRRDELERMLTSAADMSGPRRPEVDRVRAEVLKKLEEHQARRSFVAHWKLDETSGTAASDARGAHGGSLEGGPAWAAGRMGGALSFDGKDDGVRVPNAEELSPHAGPDGAMTVAAWVRISERPPASGQGRTPLLAKGDPATWEYALYVLADGRASFCLWKPDGMGYAELAGGSVALDRWHHLAGTLQKGRFARFYLDGVKVIEATTFQGDTAAGTSPLFIGRRADGQFLKGQVDDVRLYSRALTDAEVQALGSGKE